MNPELCANCQEPIEQVPAYGGGIMWRHTDLARRTPQHIAVSMAEVRAADSAPRIVSSETNIWYEATTPDGWLWAESYSLLEFKSKVADWEGLGGPGKLKLETVSQKIDYYEKVRTEMELGEQ